MAQTSNDHNDEHHSHHRHQKQQQLFGGPEPTAGAGTSTEVGAAAWTTMTRSKALKSLALVEAQAAVKFDNDGLVLEALEAYDKAVTLLEMVMKSTPSPEEYERLLAIHDSYKYRIQSLNLESLPLNPPTPTSTIISTASSTTSTSTTATSVCSLHEEPPLSPLGGVYYQGNVLNMHSSPVSPSRAEYALTPLSPHATAAISKTNNATITKSINTTDCTSTTPTTGIKTTTIAAAALALATLTAAAMPTATTTPLATTGSVDESSSLKQIKKQPPAPAPAPVPAPIRSPQPSSTSSFTILSPTTSTSTTASSSQLQQLPSSSSLYSIQLLAPPSQEHRLRRARAGSLSTATARPASPTIPVSPFSPVSPTSPTNPTSPTSPTTSTMSGHSPLRRQVRLNAKPVTVGGGLTNTTNNSRITGNLVSAAEQLQLHLQAQQLTAGGGSTNTANSSRITGNLVSAAEQLQLQAQQRLQKKPSLSPPLGPAYVPSTPTTPTPAAIAMTDSLAPCTPLPQTPRSTSPSTALTKDDTTTFIQSAPLPSLASPSAAAAPLTPNKSRPLTPDLAANRVFLTSLPNNVLLATHTPPPLKSPTSPSSPSPLSMSFTSHLPSSPPDSATSPLHRTLLQARRQQQQLKKLQKLQVAPLQYPQRQQSIPQPKITSLLSPESSPEIKESSTIKAPTPKLQHHQHQPHQEEVDRNEIDEWLPKFLTTGFDLSDSWLGGVQDGLLSSEHKPIPRQGSKGPLDKDGSQNADLASGGSVQHKTLFSPTVTTSPNQERKKQEPSTTTTKEQKAMLERKRATGGKTIYHSHRRSLSQSSLPLLSPTHPTPPQQQHHQQQQQQLLSPAPLLQSNRHDQGGRPRPSEPQQPSQLSLYSRTLGSLSMTSLNLFDDEPMTASEFLSSSPMRAHFNIKNQKPGLEQDNRDKPKPPSPQLLQTRYFEKHQRHQLHQRKQSHGGQPWVLVPRPHHHQQTPMLRSQSSFTQLSSTSAALHSPTITSTAFGSGTNLLDFISTDDPLGGLSIPRGPPPPIPPQPTDPFLRCFWLIHQLEQTMTTPEGGFLTRKIHIPRQAWYQHGGTTMVRLPAAEAKISACHTITLMLEQMVAQSKRGMLNLMIGPPTPASSATSFGPLGSPSSSGSSSGSSSSSSSFIAPYSPSSPASPSQVSFHSTASSAVSSTASLAALVSQTSTQQIQPPTPATPNKANKTTADRNSGGNSNGSTSLPSYNAIDTEQDRILLSKELEALESTALHIWAKLSKKLSFVHRPGKYFVSHTVNGTPAGIIGTVGTNITARHQQQQQQQDMLLSQEHECQGDSSKDKEHHHHHAATNAVGSGTDLKSQWKHFSKSVQKSMANDKVDDTTTYSDSVLRLFQSATILETMYRHYTALSATSSGSAYFASSLQTYYAQIINRLRRIGYFLNLVICAFVVRDLGEFLTKYNKRVSAWMVE